MRWPPNRAVGLPVLALALPGAWIDAKVFFASWLVAWWYLLGLVLGARLNLWLHRLAGGGRWGDALRPAALRVARPLPLLLLFLPLVLGMARLYPWLADPGGGWAHGIALPGFAIAWLQPAAFGLRALAYAAAWWWLSLPSTSSSRVRAAAAIAAHAVVASLASVDLLMSLLPGWYSTGFGLVVMAGQAVGGSGLCVLLACTASGGLPAPADPAAPPVARDLGNLLLMWLMLWAYLAFMELLIIWAGDLPREIRWYLPRLHGGWAAVGVGLALLQFALPLLALLQRRIKDRSGRLAGVAALLLAAQLLDTAWLVLPSVAPQGLLGWWLVPQLTLGMALLVWGGAGGRRPARQPGAAAVDGIRHARP